jgi:hypothetical protein
MGVKRNANRTGKTYNQIAAQKSSFFATTVRVLLGL